MKFKKLMKLMRGQTPDPGPQTASPAVAVAPGGVNPTTAIASLVTLASVVFTTWSVFDMATPAAPDLVALAAGAGVELVWLYILATEWQQAGRTGHLSRGLTVTGWVLAAVAAVIITVHGVLTMLALAVLAVLPLAAKAGWHWQTSLRAAATRARLEAEAQTARERAEAARREAEERHHREAEAQRRSQELSVEPTDADEREIAQLRRKAAVARLRADAEKDLVTAEAEADRMRQEAEADAERIRLETESRMRREAIENRTAEDLAVLEANAKLFRRRHEVEVELALTRPYELETGTSTRVPNDASMLQTGTPGTFANSGAGFGGAMASARSAHVSVGGSDQQVPQVPGQGSEAMVHHSAAEAEANRRKVGQVYEVLARATGEAPSIAAVARGAGISDRATGRHLRALKLI